MKNMEFEIVKHIGVIRDGNCPVELNHISWNGCRPKFDFRSWKIGDDDTKIPLKGITLSEDELRALRDILNSMEV